MGILLRDAGTAEEEGKIIRGKIIRDREDLTQRRKDAESEAVNHGWTRINTDSEFIGVRDSVLCHQNTYSTLYCANK